jgi:predicted Zn-dependent peptidase
MTTQLTVLPNGLRIISDQTDYLETAALGLWVGIGSRHEAAELQGISHFLEHMAFKGTAHATALEIAERIEQVGGYLNACTTRETTAYYARVLAQDVPLALDLLADILQFSTFQEEELEKERKVILQEIAESLDTPDDLVFDLFQQTAFPDQPLGRPIMGTGDVVKTLSRTALLDYQRQSYAASNMVLSAAGNVHHDEIVRIAAEKFNHLPIEHAATCIPAHYHGGICLHHKDLEQVHMILGFNAPSLIEPDYYTCAVLSTLLGGGVSSRLFQKVREERGLAYSIYTFLSAFTDSGVLGIYTGTDQTDIVNLLPLLRTEIHHLSGSLTLQEIERAKAQMKSSLLMGLENTASRCEHIASQMLIYGRPLSLAELVDRIEAVSPDQLIDCAEKIFATPPTLTTLGPFTDVYYLEDFKNSF